MWNNPCASPVLFWEYIFCVGYGDKVGELIILIVHLSAGLLHTDFVSSRFTFAVKHVTLSANK